MYYIFYFTCVCIYELVTNEHFTKHRENLSFELQYDNQREEKRKSVNVSN